MTTPDLRVEAAAVTLNELIMERVRIGVQYKWWADMREHWRPIVEAVLPRTGVTMATETRIISDYLADAMQEAWNEWCRDTGNVPDGFHIHGPGTTRVTANFAQGMAFVRNVTNALHRAGHRITTSDPDLDPLNAVIIEDLRKTKMERDRLLAFVIQRCPECGIVCAPPSVAPEDSDHNGD